MVRTGGGTSIPDPGDAGDDDETTPPAGPPSTTWPWLVPVIAGPLGAYIVHELSAGNMCTWEYGAMGGACRAVIIVAVLAGIGAAILSLFAARAIATHSGRGMLFTILTVVVIVLGVLGGGQFGDYQAAIAGGVEMDEPMCTWVRETLPNCVGEVYTSTEADMVRNAQATCYAREREIASYTKCMQLTKCKDIVDCVSGRVR